MRRFIASAALIAAACRPAAPSPPPLELRDAWARPADSAGTTAAYFVLRNNGPTPVTLTGESSPIAASASLHETTAMNGMVHMMPMPAPAPIAPGDSLVLVQGAKHLMISGLTRRLVPGDSVPIVLTFSDGRTLRAAASVRAP